MGDVDGVMRLLTPDEAALAVGDTQPVRVWRYLHVAVLASALSAIPARGEKPGSRRGRR